MIFFYFCLSSMDEEIPVEKNWIEKQVQLLDWIVQSIQPDFYSNLAICKFASITRLSSFLLDSQALLIAGTFFNFHCFCWLFFRRNFETKSFSFSFFFPSIFLLEVWFDWSGKSKRTLSQNWLFINSMFCGNFFVCKMELILPTNSPGWSVL